MIIRDWIGILCLLFIFQACDMVGNSMKIRIIVVLPLRKTTLKIMLNCEAKLSKTGFSICCFDLWLQCIGSDIFSTGHNIRKIEARIDNRQIVSLRRFDRKVNVLNRLKSKT